MRILKLYNNNNNNNLFTYCYQNIHSKEQEVI